MNYIKVGDEWVNLDQVSAIQDRRDWDMGKSWSGSVTLESIGEDFVAYFKGDEAAALIAWLSVPAHMAGVIAADDRDVMAWYARQQENADATETEA